MKAPKFFGTQDNFNNWADDIIKVLANISFGDGTNKDDGRNIDAYFATVNFVAANTEVEVSHRLGRVPVGYIVIRSNAAYTVYDSGTAFTKNNIYLKSTTIANTTVLIF